MYSLVWINSMRQKLLGLLLAVVTFCIGTWSSPFARTPVVFDNVDFEVNEAALWNPRFRCVEVSSLLVPGYRERYRSKQGDEVRVTGIKKTTAKEAAAQFHETVHNSGGVVESLGKYKAWFGDTGERFLIRFPMHDGSSNDSSVVIGRYNGGDSYKIISAPEVLLFEFEAFLVVSNPAGF